MIECEAVHTPLLNVALTYVAGAVCGAFILPRTGSDERLSAMREKIFVSYSHKDVAWLDMLQNKLGTGIYADAFEMWSDKRIESGKAWRREIEAGIASSRIALLLVSRNFLRSDFIINQELDSIFRLSEAAQLGEGLCIWWVPLERISDEELQYAKLDKIQAAVASPSKPLSELDEKELADAIGGLSAKLINTLKLLSDISPAARDHFKGEVAAALASTNTVIEDALAPGDYSIIYRAKRLGTSVAVKALVPVPRREWLAKDFIDRANSVRNVTNATAIVINDIFDRATKCVVMEFVSAPTLKVQLKQQGGCLPCTQVADVLAQLAGVAADLHRMDGHPIIGPMEPSHVHYDQATKKVRISLLRISNETLKSCRQRPTFLLDSDALTYLSPERYHGRDVGALVDQYYLGLLGLELLQGKPPVEVASFAHLETKRKFFESPRAFFGDLPIQQPAFSFVLTKMLEQDPRNRWTSMSELTVALQQTATGIVPTTVKRYAADNYRTKLHDNRRFFDVFYRTLFKASDEIRAIFTERGVTMDDQYRKLDGAVRYLFSFDPTIDPTNLDDHVEKHKKLGLRGKHFELFRAAFLEALRETTVTDTYSLDAWRAILHPALAFMRGRVCGEVVTPRSVGGIISGSASCAQPCGSDPVGREWTSQTSK
jgi:serine/threonine protein kinase